MTDSIKQAISALIDEEASEIEIHRVLRQYGDDASLRESWIRFQQIRSVSQGEHHLSVSQHLTLHSRISAAIDEEAALDCEPISRAKPRQWQKPAVGFAIAASLVGAVFLGVYTQQGNDELPAGVVAVPAQATGPVTPAISVQPVSTGAAQLADFESSEPELRELDEEKQQKLREYLLRHDQMARKNPYSRTVIYKQPGDKN